MMSDESPHDRNRNDSPIVIDYDDYGWGVSLGAAVCENCDWCFFHSLERIPKCCPFCFQVTLSNLDQDEISHLITNPPEQYLSFEVNRDSIKNEVQEFIKAIRFSPKDLSLQNLSSRLERVFIPKWLVDADVNAIWEAEVGYDYQVISHRERYDQNSSEWKTQEITEARIRWESRVGRLVRTYHNILSPGVEEDVEILKKIGKYELSKVQEFEESVLSDTHVRLPNRSKEDAWIAALPSLQSAASSECKIAADADHIRQFRWKPAYDNHNWTLLLLPIYTTYYLDDDGAPQVVVLHGQTGRINGARKASMKRALRTSMMIIIAAMVIFMLSLIVTLGTLIFQPLLILGGAGFLLSMFLVILAVMPVGLVWQFNRKENRKKF
jgi:hypothetical protein